MAPCPVIANRDPMRKRVPCLPWCPILPLLAAGFLLIPALQATAGAEASSSDPLSLRLAPDKTTLRWKGASQQFSVVATFAGGRSKDVTAQAEFSLAHPVVARPGPGGRVMAAGDGGDAAEGDLRFLGGPGRAGGGRLGPPPSFQLRTRDRRHPYPAGLQRHCLPRRGQGPRAVSGFPSTPLIPGRITVGSSRAASFRY